MWLSANRSATEYPVYLLTCASVLIRACALCACCFADELELRWSDDRRQEEEFGARDGLVVDGLSDLLGVTTRREEVIADISSQLQDELAVLADFLENVAKRRPKGLSPIAPPHEQNFVHRPKSFIAAAPKLIACRQL